MKIRPENIILTTLRDQICACGAEKRQRVFPVLLLAQQIDAHKLHHALREILMQHAQLAVLL